MTVVATRTANLTRAFHKLEAGLIRLGTDAVAFGSKEFKQADVDFLSALVKSRLELLAYASR